MSETKKKKVNRRKNGENFRCKISIDITISSYVDSCALTSQASSEAVDNDPKASAQEESLVYLLSPQSLCGDNELLSAHDRIGMSWCGLLTINIY